MRLIKLHHEDLTLFGHDISAADYSFFAKHKDAFRRMFREQGLMFWRRFLVSFKAYTMSYGIIENPLQKSNGKHYHHMVTDAYDYLERQIMRNTTNAPKVFVEDSGILAQSRHLLGGIEAKPYRTSKDPFYMKETREVFRRVFGDPKEGPYLTLRVYIMYPLCMKMGATLCKLLRRWLDASDSSENETYWIAPSVDLFFSFGFHDEISRLRHDIDAIRKERGSWGVDIPRPPHLTPTDTLTPDNAQFLNPPETTTANRADILAAKKEEKRLKKKKEKEKEVTTETSTAITGLEMKRGAEGTKFKVQFAQGGVSQVDVTRKGEEVKIKVTRTTTANGIPQNDDASARELQKVLEDDVDSVRKTGKTKEQTEKEQKEKEEREREEKEEREAREHMQRRVEEAKVVEEAFKRSKEANKGKPVSKESEYLRKKAKETFAEIDKETEKMLAEGKKPFGIDDPLIKLLREAVEDSPEEADKEDDTASVASTTSSASSTSSKKKLRACANCKMVEAVRKTYKACQRCRERKMKKPKYYCSRTCQVKDWEARHKKEHKDLDSKLQTAALQEPEGDEDPDEACFSQVLEHLRIHQSYSS